MGGSSTATQPESHIVSQCLGEPLGSPNKVVGRPRSRRQRSCCKSKPKPRKPFEASTSSAHWHHSPLKESPKFAAAKLRGGRLAAGPGWLKVLPGLPLPSEGSRLDPSSPRKAKHPPWGSNPRPQGQGPCALPTELGGLLSLPHSRSRRRLPLGIPVALSFAAMHEARDHQLQEISNTSQSRAFYDALRHEFTSTVQPSQEEFGSAWLSGPCIRKTRHGSETLHCKSEQGIGSRRDGPPPAAGQSASELDVGDMPLLSASPRLPTFPRLM